MRLAAPAIWAWFLLAAGCAAPQSTLLRKVAEIHADGTRAPVMDEKLSAFVHLVRARLPTAKGTVVAAIVALEKDVSEGTGAEGFYAAVVRTSGGGAELRYFEQSQHLPRVDRFYHRALTATEVGELDAVMKKVPLAALPKVATQVAAVATQPTSAPAEAAMPEAGGDAAAEVALPLEVAYQVTAADSKTGETVQVRAFEGASGPGVIGLLDRWCAGSGFACTYSQPIPATARVLFADPHRKVVAVWTQGEELRAMITGGERMEDDEENWFAFKEGKWELSEEPDPSIDVPTTAAEPTEGATPPATAPASLPAPLPAASKESRPEVPLTTRPLRVEVIPRGDSALVPQDVHAQAAATAGAEPGDVPAPATTQAATTEPTPFSNPGMLAEEESWWSEPGESFTTVWHYLPLSETNSQRLGFVVPAFVFDDEHAAINLSQRMLYILHDGHLIALPIPPAAFGRK